MNHSIDNESASFSPAESLVSYFNEMVAPKPFQTRTGEALGLHQIRLRRRIFEAVGLHPLPERIPLDVVESEVLDHEWCTVRAVTYSLWPGVRGRGYLYRPKALDDVGPAILSPVGHWPDGNRHPDVQTRCLNFARLGYTVLSTTQHHYEDLPVGVSHQTTMIWNNMRGLDLLQQLEGVDSERIGCEGCSGGGLQTQMLAALDSRIKAASIAGITCDYRELLFPHRAHCVCNHWPNAMRFTDQPEIAALAFPTPIQFLTMDDWTKPFERDNLPGIQRLYRDNGFPERVGHHYWPTPHTYDTAKRERTYQWMECWLRGNDVAVTEEETTTFYVEVLVELMKSISDFGDNIRDGGLESISSHYRARKPQRVTRRELKATLSQLLGIDSALAVERTAERAGESQTDDQVVESWLIPGEGPISIPVVIVRGAEPSSRFLIYCTDDSKEERLSHNAVAEAFSSGMTVVLPDVRFVGALSLESLRGKASVHIAHSCAHPLEENDGSDYLKAWTRNGILWGRPLPGMAASDILAVRTFIGSEFGGDSVDLEATGEIGAGATFAALFEDGFDEVRIDLTGRSWEEGTLPLVPNILKYGDVDLWMDLIEERGRLK